MKTSEKLLGNKKELEDKIGVLLEEFIKKNGNFEININVNQIYIENPSGKRIMGFMDTSISLTI